MSPAPFPPSVAVRRPLLVLLALLLAACGSDDAVGPDEDIAFLVGDWTATEILITNPENPEQVIDIVELGAIFTLNVQPSGQYTASMLVFGQPASALGTLEVRDDQLILHQEIPQVETQVSTYTYADGQLTMEGQTLVDINSDGEDEVVELALTLEKQD